MEMAIHEFQVSGLYPINKFGDTDFICEFHKFIPEFPYDISDEEDENFIILREAQDEQSGNYEPSTSIAGAHLHRSKPLQLQVLV